MNEWLTLKMAGGDARPEPRKPVAGTLAALALVALIGVLDYVTGSEVILEILYLVPVVLSTSRRASVTTAVSWRSRCGSSGSWAPRGASP